MSKEVEVLLAGVGGQGIAVAGVILAEAAGLYDGYNVVQTEEYGVSARGGNSCSAVIISDEEIDKLSVYEPDILVAMTQTALTKFGAKVKRNGIIIADSTCSDKLPDGKAAYLIPFTEIARDELKNRMVANVLALAALSAIGKVVSAEALRQAVAKRAPAAFKELNLRALERGLGLARSALPASK